MRYVLLAGAALLAFVSLGCSRTEVSPSGVVDKLKQSDEANRRAQASMPEPPPSDEPR